MDSEIPPWSHGPAELIRHAMGHLESDGDTDRRLALIGFDNAIEACVEAFVNLHPRQRGDYAIARPERDVVLRNYHEKVLFLERYLSVTRQTLGVSIEHLIWYHTLRNELYHSGNGMTPEKHHVIGAGRAAAAVFRALFGADAVKASPAEELKLESSGSTSHRLDFLAAYSELEDAIAKRVSSRRDLPLSELWRQMGIESAPHTLVLIEQAISTRNALVAGDEDRVAASDLASLASSLRRMADRLPARRASEQTPSVRALASRPYAEAAWEIARGVDPDRRGVEVRDIIDLLALRGVRPKARDLYRATYSALNAAQDIFNRVGRGRFAWKDAEAENPQALSASELAVVVRQLMQERDVAGPVHYQDLVKLALQEGYSVKGPDRGRTMYVALTTGQGANLFRRVASGMFDTTED